MSKPKKCFPGRHAWVNKAMAGIFAAEFLDQCARCGWWKVWGVDMAGSWKTLYPPSQYVRQVNKRTKVERFIRADHANDKPKKKWRWQ